MAAASWASLPALDTVFVLVTGANSGVGLGICEHVIDTFLSDHPLTSHLVLLPTTRSTKKGNETVKHLRAYLLRAASSNASLRARGVRDLTAGAIDRVHIAAVQLDLCDLASVQDAANKLMNDKIFFEDVQLSLAIPRLDAVVFNAGIGGWTHVSWPGLAWDMLTAGWVHATTRPLSKRSVPGLTINPLPKLEEGTVPELGMVFCANVFGHYMFAHHLMPMLQRRQQRDDGITPGRIIWQSSVGPHLGHIDVADIQGLKNTHAYESSKMLTDVLALTAELPGVRHHSASFYDSGVTVNVRRPKVYLAHPGVVATTMFPLHFTLMWAYIIGVTISRWLGSPWHPVSPYKGGAAATWLALSSQKSLDAQKAERCKWGSCTDFWGTTYVKQTEVDGWGWDGSVESAEEIAKQDAAERRVLRKSVGRWRFAELVTEEKRAQFDQIGAQCWEQMEDLRIDWEERVEELEKLAKK